MTPEKLSVVELCARFLRHAEIDCRDADGKPTSELKSFKRVIRELGSLYGRLSPADLAYH